MKNSGLGFIYKLLRSLKKLYRTLVNSLKKIKHRNSTTLANCILTKKLQDINYTLS